MPKDDVSVFMPVGQKLEGRHSVRAWVVFHSIAWGLFLAILFVAVKKLEVIFKDFGIDLPAITVLFIKISHLGLALVPLILGILAIDLFVLNSTSGTKEPRGYRTWCLLMLALPIVLFVAALVSFFVPLINLDIGLQG